MLRLLVHFRCENKLHVLVTDKEGYFVVMNSGLYSQKSEVAVVKNFKALKAEAVKVKQQALSLFEEINVPPLAASVKKAKNVFLQSH